MLIRSQNKGVIFNFENVSNIFCFEGKNYFIKIETNAGHEYMAGEYPTKESALKVLSEIIQNYNERELCYSMPQKDEIQYKIKGGLQNGH